MPCVNKSRDLNSAITLLTLYFCQRVLYFCKRAIHFRKRAIHIRSFVKNNVFCQKTIAYEPYTSAREFFVKKKLPCVNKF